MFVLAEASRIASVDGSKVAAAAVRARGLKLNIFVSDQEVQDVLIRKIVEI